MAIGRLRAAIPVTPLPPFFTADQLRQALNRSGVDLLLCGHPERARALDSAFKPHPLGPQAFYRRCAKQPLPNATALITYTSGSTGHPKGVCLSGALLDAVCQALFQRVGRDNVDRHVCVLPLPVLLENLAGGLLPLYAGSRVVLFPSAATGLTGSSQIDPQQWGAFLHQQPPESLILTPELLKVLLQLCAAGLNLPSLKLVAVGGGPDG